MEQIFTITMMSLRNLPARAGAAWVSLLGIAGVVLVVVAVLAMAAGFEATLAQAGSDDIAIVVRGGSTDEMSSNLTSEASEIIVHQPEVSSGAQGPHASAELYVTVDVPKRSTGTWANVPLRGMAPTGPALRPKFKLEEGRMFEAGRAEIIVGVGARRAFSGLELGDTLKSGNARWQVVGIFSDGGGVTESEIWTDARGVQSAYSRGSVFQSVRARLKSPQDITAYRDRLTTDKRLSVSVKTEREFLAAQSRDLAGLINGAGMMIGILMGAGAIFGALNTMYSAIASRAREIATLRAVGFGPGPIFVSVLTEALLLALFGGILGGLIAFLAFNGYEASTLNFQTFSQVTFAFDVTPQLLVRGIFYALLLGLIGGVFPAIKAVRQPIVEGLRAI